MQQNVCQLGSIQFCQDPLCNVHVIYKKLVTHQSLKKINQRCGWLSAECGYGKGKGKGERNKRGSGEEPPRRERKNKGK